MDYINCRFFKHTSFGYFTKKIIFVILIQFMRNYAACAALLILFASCGISGEAVLNETENTAAHPREELQGTFTSKKGVMHPVSCYGYNIGFLKTEGAENIIVCFDRISNSMDLEIPSQSIYVKGHSENKTIEAIPDNPCESGTRKVFYVEEWHILN
jgi:hypothetical protein